MYKKLAIITISIALSVWLLAVIFHSFNSHRRSSVIGKYESMAPSKMEQAKFLLSNIECFDSGRALSLFADSTFTLIDSSSTLTGTWHQKTDLIELHIQLNGEDSALNKNGKLTSPLQDFSLDYFNPDLYYFIPNAGRNCMEIFKIK